MKFVAENSAIGMDLILLHILNIFFVYDEIFDEATQNWFQFSYGGVPFPIIFISSN